jgi:Calcineurin-like phosphoesterase.
MSLAEYERLSRYCNSPEQEQRLKNYYDLGTHRKAADAEGVSKNAIYQTMSVLRTRASRAGDTPDADAAGHAPAGFSVKGKSTLYDKDGNIKVQWVKTQEDREKRHEALLDELQVASERVKGLSLLTPVPEELDEELLAIYPYGDPHMGMYAWHGDSEEDFDLSMAVNLMVEATTSLVQSAPPSKKALIAFLGDFYHADNQSNTTVRSGHQLDVDSRWLKVFRVGVNTAVTLIELAKRKHEEVHVIVEIGNHDDHSALALGVCLEMFFSNDERVTIDNSGQRYHYYRFGDNLIGIHHGDLSKPASLPGIMACDRPQDWGETLYRSWYTGHIHNQTRYDLAGCEVESFRILPPRDAWSQGMGYRGHGRSMDCIVRHTSRGEIARHTVRAADFYKETEK